MTGVDELLAQIDHALDDGISHDAMRWTPAPPEAKTRGLGQGIQIPWRPAYTTVEINVDISAWTAAMDRAAAACRAAMQRLSELLKQAAESARPAVADKTDPRARALELRRTRNTGPAARRLDGRRTR